MNPLALFYTLILGVLVLSLKREYVIFPVVTGLILIPLSTGLNLGPMTFSSSRIVLIFAFIRVIARKEYEGIELNEIDKAIIWYVVAMIITGVAPRRDLTIIYRFGKLYDTLGFYFVFRFWVRNKKELFFFIAGLAVLLLVLGAEMLYERKYNFNLFSYLGGPSSPAIRDGKIRAQGTFSHAILAGTVGATSIALFSIILFEKGIWKAFAIIGICSSFLIIISSASSGPIMSFALLIVGLSTWFFIDNMTTIRWGIVLTLLVLEITMDSHIWYLIGRIDLTGSSTGYHRSELINSAILYFNEWWFVGTDYTRHWMRTGVTWSPLHTDITNHYIQQAVNGGLSVLVTFILVLYNGFKYVGITCNNLRPGDNKIKFIVWTYGATLFSHTVTFFSVSYFDQSINFFFLNVALIASSQFLLEENNPIDNEDDIYI